MRSALPKVLHEVAGLPMVCHAVRTAEAAGGDAHAVVVGREAQKVEAAVRAVTGAVSFHEQTQRLGTGHAVLSAREAIARGHDDLLVLFADTPLTRPQTLIKLRALLADGADVAVLGFRTPDPAGYGRLVVDNGQLAAIREERDASEAERAITFCNGGIMAINGHRALELLSSIGNANAKGEYYLTDVVEIARSRGLTVVAHEAPEEEVLGVNTRVELARVESIWQARRRTELMLAGVTMLAPESVYVSHDTQIGTDTILEPSVWLGTGVSIGSGVTIHSFTHLKDTSIADNCHIGPFARMRGNARLEEGAHIGNFVELKNVAFGEGAKASHLTYLGDATVGAKANIGAGTITCNYDGVNKHRTLIGAGAFIGSNSALVAPVSIGEGAYIGSGSVIVEDVPADAMAVARGRQANKPGYAGTIRQRALAAKAEKQAKQGK
jgi:bifunctional UDP-N-acetylglucosamine pyrophosphorylase / glucosamine-1-phosphate N-acetyltransferase